MLNLLYVKGKNFGGFGGLKNYQNLAILFPPANHHFLGNSQKLIPVKFDLNACTPKLIPVKSN